MPRIPPVDRTTLDAKTAATLAAVELKLGVVPNIHATLAHSPAALASYARQGEALANGRLSARQRELIALAVGQVNECQYCLSAHTAIGKKVGLGEGDIAKARQGNATQPLDNALVQLAQKITRTRANLDEADIAAARKAGVDDGLLVELIANVAVNTLTNYLNHIAGTEIDFPVVPLEDAA